MRKKVLALAAVALCAQPVWADDHPTFQSLSGAIAQRPDCKSMDDIDLTIVDCEKDYSVWYFTKPGHPAYPGVIAKFVAQEGGGVILHEQGWSFASDAAQPAFKTFLAQVQALDEQLKEDTARNAGHAPPAGPPIAVQGNWRPQGTENNAIVSLTTRYFALEDGGQYADAYALLDPGLTSQWSFAQYQSSAEGRRTTAGRVVKGRTIKAIDWEKDSPNGPPGLYAAVDYSAQTEKGQLCGYVVWKRQPDQFFILVREETNEIPSSLTTEQAAEVMSKFHCVK